MQIDTCYINENHDEERAFYGIRNARLKDCTFAGTADGESALKETANLEIENCHFLLRYPLWHTTNTHLTNSKMTDTCRAALWYDNNLVIHNSYLGGIKALRESSDITLTDCQIDSLEFGWFCKNLTMQNCQLVSEYPFLHSTNLEFDRLTMQGKYSFQYTKDVVINNSQLETKDAFWHSKNVTVYDSVLQGEYLGWYSENLHLVRCKIIGTQPLCYAKGLILEDCEMINCDLAFEKSEVTATIQGIITSVKNPLSGTITADSIGEIIQDQPENTCTITTRLKKPSLASMAKNNSVSHQSLSTV